MQRRMGEGNKLKENFEGLLENSPVFKKMRTAVEGVSVKVEAQENSITEIRALSQASDSKLDLLLERLSGATPPQAPPPPKQPLARSLQLLPAAGRSASSGASAAESGEKKTE